MGISTFKLTIVAAILFQAVISNQILIQVPEILHKEFKIEWYEFTNRYAIEHYKENTVIRNEEFYNFTKKIDDLMHKKILNVTKVDITNTSVDSTELLGELYRNGSVTSEQLTEIVDFGRRLQYPYTQKVIEFYDLKPSHFNTTEEIFCDVFDCPTTITTVTEKVTTTPTSTPEPTTTNPTTTITTTQETKTTTIPTTGTTTDETTTTTDLELERNLDVVSENGQNITTEVSNDEVDTIEDILKANVSEVDKIEDRMDIVNESETTVNESTSSPTTITTTTATTASPTTTKTTTIITTTETVPTTRNDPLAVPISENSSATKSAVPTTFLVIMSINFIMNCLLHF